ncbi:uncharacterized protein LOC8259039 [Ricinus communis]|uniref:uncharacterized protein LOC8259039 n=1 Tax=Ricinus communis TaxID=3988 RepID=UPI00201A768D|nr:uncharacterized protein LOC8259039 [Ricinus communis]
MGNKVCTLLRKYLKNHKKPKDVIVKSKVVIPNEIFVHNNNDDYDDVFLTPKSDHTDSDEEHQENNSPTFICDICVEEKALNDSFNLKGCTHFYCIDCTVRYVTSKLDDNLISISCPGSDCEGMLEPEYCRQILPQDVFDRWGIALCESLIDGSQKFYCPFKDCSGLLIDDTGMEIEKSECPFCKRSFCVKCKVPWHSELSCKKFQKLKKKGDDSMLVDLAKRKNWRRCPKCKYYVEKSVGCFYMKCRCGYAFCYRCGACSSTSSHFCPKCKHWLQQVLPQSMRSASGTPWNVEEKPKSSANTQQGAPSSKLFMEFQQTGVSKDSRHKPKTPKQEKPISRKKQKVEKSAEMTETVELDDLDGFFYTPISKKGNKNTTEISVESYSEERDLNVAILASLQSTSASNNNKQLNFNDLSQDYRNYCYIDDENDDLRVLDFTPLPATSKKEMGKNRFGFSVTEKGHSSEPNDHPQFVCEICVESKTADESLAIRGCTHAYCTDCMAKYVASKIQENITGIYCPVSGCGGLLEPEYCRSILPQEVFDRWGNALCEALNLGSQKFYCPFKDCSAMLINDGGEVIRESECPHCRRLFCAHCKVPWHSGIDCNKFQTLHKDEREKEDIMLMKLAENKKWRRCPICRIYVERTEGCRYMKCRCGTHFCYSCGTTKINTQSHYCNHCKG